jgi:cytosine/adenosine deaminase-related metal-dependent hydrolase
MIRKIQADFVLPVSGKPIPDGIVIVDEKGMIREVSEAGDTGDTGVEKLRGTLVPGFVNAHCHLELSHMKGTVDTGTGLLPFISTVVNFREVEHDVILAAIKAADEEMWENGIVAVGDISNKTDTHSQKIASPIYYHTFVECFDFQQDAWAEKTLNQYLEVYKGFCEDAGHAKSLVPHAPYTVSKTLFSLINKHNRPGDPVSIHNQETPAENELFRTGGGAFLEFFKSFDIDFSGFQPSGQSSIMYTLGQLDKRAPTLMVHNTLTGREDIEHAEDALDRICWVTCPNANMYIENRLPNYRLFMQDNIRVAIGTDSLTSNWQLSILEEIKTIARFQSHVPMETLIRWATLNGAEALGIDDRFGSIDKGKSPGLNLLSTRQLAIGPDTTVRKIL